MRESTARLSTDSGTAPRASRGVQSIAVWSYFARETKYEIRRNEWPATRRAETSRMTARPDPPSCVSRCQLESTAHSQKASFCRGGWMDFRRCWNTGRPPFRLARSPSSQWWNTKPSYPWSTTLGWRNCQDTRSRNGSSLQPSSIRWTTVWLVRRLRCLFEWMGDPVPGNWNCLSMGHAGKSRCTARATRAWLKMEENRKFDKMNNPCIITILL